MSTQQSKPFGKRLSRRQALQLMGGITGMAALAACTAAPVAPATGGEGAAEPAQVAGTMLVVHRREYFKEMEDLFAQAVQNWAQENNVEVETSTVASEAFEDFVAKTLAEVQAGNPPDLIYHVRLVQQLYFYDALEPVSDTVEKAIGLYGEPSLGHRMQNFIDGEWWGIPYINGGGGEFARRSVFEGQGIDPLEDLVTWDDRRDACLQVTDVAAEMYGWGRTVNRSGDGAGLVQAVIHDWGGHITDENMTEITFNSPETVAAVAWLTEIYTSEQYAPMLPPGVISWTDSSNNEAYLAGNIAYTGNAASVYAKAKADQNPVFEDTVVLNVPVGPYGQPHIGAGGGGQLHVPKGAKHVELAKELSLYLLEPDVFIPISLISAGLFLPAYQKYYEMDPVVQAFEADPNLQRMGEQQLGDYPGLSWPAQPSPFFDAIAAQSILTDMMAETITQGVSPEEAVAHATDRIIQIAEEMGALG
ncbi:extracellular solute-binding protein [Litorilinea aerophila]|uniref:ABC transporter substrate-binding protein n=1 Tax=Litorilinea aerophila TaxID=1204385 RepID=UPI001476EC65|nr:extracellular solute-binding protein [Litorilinea aerophila]MCC9077984.1 extracellular solute-binding protein [Litorilinea aerophila]